MAAPMLFYDGPCRLCQRSVRWVRKHAPGVVCVPLQGEEAEARLPANLLTPPLQGVVFIDPAGQIHVAHRGIHALAPHASFPWRWLLRCVPGWGYRLVARTRSMWGRDEGCSVG